LAITKVRHVWAEPSFDPSVLQVEFDRQLTDREASELAQAVAGVHERHEVARDFAANDPHHPRHFTAKERKALFVDRKGDTPMFVGTCGDCGRDYIAGAKEPHHYVCPSLPSENDIFVKLKHPPVDGDAIDCGRDGFGNPIRKVG
jgi:hypothetical protein